MAPELSSNWKKLQAKIKEESAVSAPDKGKKRKAEGQPRQSDSLAAKKRKVSRDSPTKKPGHSQQRQTNGQASQRPQMGAAQSSEIKNRTELGVSPSLALWAEDNGVSAEDLAEAYGLGIKDESLVKSTAVHPNQGLNPDVEVGKYVAIDCEMVGVGDRGSKSVLARISVVDFHGRQIYDSFVRAKETVTDWRTHVSGVSRKHMATARDFDQVQNEVAELLKGRIIVGHDIKHDLQVLMLDHPSKLIRDTAKFSGFRKYGHGPKPALRVLAKEVLGLEIQTGQHSSIEDARVAMLLFRRHKPAFDVENANRFPDQPPEPKSKRPGKSKKKKKRKN